MNKDNGLHVKLIYKHFDNGDILPGRFAIQVDDTTYRIVKKDKSVLDVKIGDLIPKAGKVSVDHNGNLNIGAHTVIVGNEPLDGWSATSVSKNKFKITSPDGNIRDVKVDESVAGLGMLTKDEHGRIYINGKNIPIFNKKYELNLICTSNDYQGGKTAYFNTIIKGDADNKKNGIPGIFRAGQNGRPSSFCELGPDNKYYPTAFIKPNDDGRTVRVLMRTLPQAVEERYLKYEMERIKKEEADPFGIDPNDVMEYVAVKERLDNLLSICWQQREFGVTRGHRVLGMPNKKLESSYVPSR
ncbi:hypothetical protein ACI2KR_07555 [Pseudomonas luteola]